MSEGPVPLNRRLLDEQFPLPGHEDADGKDDRGRLLVVAGSRELAGAAWLAGIGGLRAGAGKLQIATAASVSMHLAIAIPEARVIPLGETEAGCIAETEEAGIIDAIADADAAVMGCGLEGGAPLSRLIGALLDRRLAMPLVLDAAALGDLADHDAAARAWPGGLVILPHAGEMARLLGRDREAVSADPVAAAREAATRFGATTLMKGGSSHIVAADGRHYWYEGGGLGLATSGSGDTLAGIVGGIAARGADPLTALLWGVWLHGEAGRQLARETGRIGFLARELLPLVPRLME